MTRPKDRFGLYRDPSHCRLVFKKSQRDPDRWWYEEVGGITVVMQGKGQAWIPVGQLRGFLKRHDKAEDPTDG